MSDTPDTLVDAPEAFDEMPFFPMVDTSHAERQFNAYDWYWHFQDGTILNSRRYWLRLTTNDPDYLAFMAAGNPRINMPRDAAGNDSLDELQTQVLDHYGLHATLAHYAGAVRWAKTQEPVPVTIGSGTYRFQADDDSRNALSQAVVLGQVYESKAGTGSYTSPWKTADGYAAAPLTLTDLATAGLTVGAAVQAMFTAEADVLDRIASRTITTPDGVDAYFADPAAADEPVPAKTAKTAAARKKA